jgi:uncharacterized protein with ATP-grasp and redox domains
MKYLLYIERKSDNKWGDNRGMYVEADNEQEAVQACINLIKTLRTIPDKEDSPLIDMNSITKAVYKLSNSDEPFKKVFEQ